jgi:hypothetical protein
MEGRSDRKAVPPRRDGIRKPTASAVGRLRFKKFPLQIRASDIQINGNLRKEVARVPSFRSLWAGTVM